MAITKTLALDEIEVTNDPYVIRGIQDRHLIELIAADFERIRNYQPFRYKTLNRLEKAFQRAKGRTKTVLASVSDNDFTPVASSDLTLYSPVAVSKKFGSFCISAAAQIPNDGVDMAFEASLTCNPYQGFTLHAAKATEGPLSHNLSNNSHEAQEDENIAQYATFNLQPIADVMPSAPLPADARNGLAIIYFALETAY